MTSKTKRHLLFIIQYIIFCHFVRKVVTKRQLLSNLAEQLMHLNPTMTKILIITQRLRSYALASVCKTEVTYRQPLIARPLDSHL